MRGHDMTRRDWWIGIALIACALLLHAAVPRYEWRERHVGNAATFLIRIDRWTGSADYGRWQDGRWMSQAAYLAAERGRRITFSADDIDAPEAPATSK